MPAESEHLEFKEAKQQFDTTKLMRYCVALANECGGHLVLGVSDKLPRRVVGSQAFSAASDLNDMKSRIVDKLRMRVSLVIGAAKEAGAIKADESETSSTRYARYLPFWT